MKTKIESFVWIYPYVVITNDKNPPMGNLKGVTIEEYVQICTMTTVLPGLTIGGASFVGANSLVTKNVGFERYVVGTPARDICSVRELRDDNNESYLPWKENLKEYRGYPWQKEK